MSTISVIIPACNEQERIASTITALREIAGIDEIIVVDDGSSDNTAVLAENAGADTVMRQRNAGKGAALNAGVAIATGDILLLIDADLGESASEACKLINPVRSGTADMTIATFPVIPGKGGGVGLVVRLARFGIRQLTGRSVTAPLSGQRAITRKLFDEVGGFAGGWGVEVALTVNALWREFTIMEIPTTMTHRVTGRSVKEILHRARQLFGAASILLRLWIRRPKRTRATSERK